MHFAIVQNWGLGDLVMTTPVIAEFRRLYPDSRLTLIVRGPAQASLLADSPLVDQVLVMPARSELLGMLRFFLGLRQQHFDVAFVGTRISVLLPLLLKLVSRIRTIVGDGDELKFLYSVRNSIDPNTHRVERMLTTFSMWSGKEPAAPQFPLPCSHQLVSEARRDLANKGVRTGPFIIIHPGSSVNAGTDKRIPVAVAQRIAERLIRRHADLHIAYIFGPDEVDLLPRFSDIGEREILLSGYSLASTIAIIAQASGLVGTDSSLGHIAASFGVPTVTLCGPTIPTETAPFGDNAKVVKRLDVLECQPCWGTPLYGRCPYGVRCMNELPEAEIIAIASSWIDPENGDVASLDFASN